MVANWKRGSVSGFPWVPMLLTMWILAFLVAAVLFAVPTAIFCQSSIRQSRRDRNAVLRMMILTGAIAAALLVRIVIRSVELFAAVHVPGPVYFILSLRWWIAWPREACSFSFSFVF